MKKIINHNKGAKMMTANKIVIINSDLGNFAFTYDDKNNLVSQGLGKQNQLYFSDNPEEAGNLYEDWDEVDFLSNLDNGYKEMIELAIKQLK
jgi:hypothetical protein